MKKILLLFIISFVPNVAFSACTPPSQWGDGYEYSECQFLAQPALTGGVKSFWGNPKLTGAVLDSSGFGIGDFILTKGVHCGTCGYKDDGVTPRFENKSNNAFGNYDSLGYDCPSDYPKKDDEAILAYVATDVSEHGAEFCLTQFAAASHSKERFIYHQVPRMDANRNGLKCAWYCEPGWDGDRCMTSGLGGTVQEDISYTFSNYVINTLDNVQKKYADKTFCKNLGTSPSLGNYCLAVIEKTDAAIGRTAVLDYKKIKSSDVWYQQQIVIGATEFMAHGIKAKPIWLGASGTHHPCEGSDDYTRISAKEIGGKERILCLRGYTLNDDCEKSTAETMKGIRYCNGWRAMDGIRFKGGKADYFENSNAYYIKLSDDGEGPCKELKCTNGMSFHDGDNFSCSSCDEKAGLQGLCYGTTNCKWCGYGKCLNKTTCKCDSCAAIVTQEEMKIGPNKLEQCWRLIDADEFRACVTGNAEESGSTTE